MRQHCKRSLTIFLLSALFLASCTEDKRPLPDVSDIEAPLSILRFEQDLFKLDTTDLANALQELALKYPTFAELFSTRILEAGSIGNMNAEQLEYFQGFITSPVYRAVYDTTQLIYPDLEKVQEELQQAANKAKKDRLAQLEGHKQEAEAFLSQLIEAKLLHSV